MDVPNAQRPDAIVPILMILEVRERIDYKGKVLLKLDEKDLRDKMRQLVEHQLHDAATVGDRPGRRGAETDSCVPSPMIARHFRTRGRRRSG